MNFGRTIEASCVNVAQPPDSRCADAAFALANPSICPVAPFLVLKPAIALLCALGSIQLRAVYTKDGVENDVTDQCRFTTSDDDVAVVGVTSGNATGLSAGSVTFTATYLELSASAQVEVLGGNCCDDQTVAMMVCLDTSKSMSQAFNGSYATRLVFGKAAASRFIGEVNQTKDVIGLMTFNDALTTVLSSPSNDKAAVGALVGGIAQTQQKTSFYDCIAQARAELAAISGADRQIIILVSDFEDSTASYNDANSPIAALDDFKSGGGIVICLGVRSAGRGFALASRLATGGFFVNAFGSNSAAALDYVSGLKGYVCAGNCTPEGDAFVATGALNYADFENWDVLDGFVDLQGNGFFDLLPGNGLYVDLISGAQPSGVANGRLELKDAISIVSGHDYRVTARLAGNQNISRSDTVRIKVFYRMTDTDHTPVNIIDQVVSLSDFAQGFFPYAFAFTADTDREVYISIQQQNVPTGGGVARAGVLLSEVKFEDVTDLITLLDDDFDTENVQYVPPACGVGSVPVPDYNTDVIIVTGAGTSALNGTYNKISPTQYNHTSGNYSMLLQDERWFIYDLFAVSQYSIAESHFPTGNWSVDNDNAPAPTVSYGTNGSTYESGYGGCYGEGCLESPPVAQVQDPSPLPDIEAGYTPPKTYTATKSYCATCPAGTVNAPATNLVPVMTGATTPSGVVTSTAGAATGFEAWHIFDQDDETWMTLVGIIAGFVAYQFSAAKTVTHYTMVARPEYVLSAPKNWTLEGSNNGTAWTVLDTRSEISWYAGERKSFNFTNTTAYTYYRINITSNVSGEGTSNLELAGLELYADAVTSFCEEASATSEISQQDADSKALAAATAAAVALLNCVVQYTSTQQYTAICPVGQFGPRITKTATRTSLVSQQEADAAALAAATEAALDELDCTGSNNTQRIAILDGDNPPTPSDPYPSVQRISGKTGVITKVTCTVKKIDHGSPDDIHILLVSPSGTIVELMRGAGGSLPLIVNASITFDDAAGGFVPAPIVEGTYKPTLIGGELTYPVPAPAPPYGTALSNFNGEDPNGSWALYVCDDTHLDFGHILLGWELNITSA